MTDWSTPKKSDVLLQVGLYADRTNSTQRLTPMIPFDGDLRWNHDTQELAGWVEVNGERVFVRVPRDLIHTKLPVYSDAVEWEIDRFKDDIVRRLQSDLA